MQISFLKKNITLLSIIVLLHIAWFIIGLMHHSFHNGDTDDYIFLARNMKQGIYYCADINRPVIEFLRTSRPPLYPLLLLLSYALFGLNDLPIVILQNIISVASCLMILDLFQVLFPEKRFRWIYLAFLLFYPAQMCFASVLAPDTLLQFLLTLYFRKLIFSYKRPSSKDMAWMGLWLILATLAKPVMYPFLILHLLFAAGCYFKTKLWQLLLLGSIPLLTIIGYGYWNKARTGLYHISSIQSDNLLNANVRAFLNSKYGQAYGDSVLDAANIRVHQQKGLKAQYECADKIAKTIIKDNFVSYTFYHLKESARFFIAPGKFDLDIYTGLGTDRFQPEAPSFYTEFKKNGLSGAWKYLQFYPLLPMLLLILFFNVLRIIGWLLFLCNRRYSFALKLFSTIYILYFALVTGPVSNTRYFLPVLLIMSALGALGFAGVIKRPYLPVKEINDSN